MVRNARSCTWSRAESAIAQIRREAGQKIRARWRPGGAVRRIKKLNPESRRVNTPAVFFHVVRKFNAVERYAGVIGELSVKVAALRGRPRGKESDRSVRPRSISAGAEIIYTVRGSTRKVSAPGRGCDRSGGGIAPNGPHGTRPIHPEVRRQRGGSRSSNPVEILYERRVDRDIR